MKKLVITDEHLTRLHDLNILPRYNHAGPKDGLYGWIRAGDEIVLRKPLTIEENVGLYGGRYKPFRGGLATHGFATVGSFSSIASPIPEAMTVGRYCGISTGLRVIDSAHPLETLTMSGAMFRPRNKLYQRVTTPTVLKFGETFANTPEEYPSLGHDVWIGANVTLSPKVKIGTGAMIATSSIVTRDVPPYAIVGGNPAKLIKFRFPQPMIARLLASKWWDYEPQEVFLSDPTDIEAILERIESGKVARYVPRTFRFD